jgi:hypothetical protein
LNHDSSIAIETLTMIFVSFDVVIWFLCLSGGLILDFLTLPILRGFFSYILVLLISGFVILIDIPYDAFKSITASTVIVAKYVTVQVIFRTEVQNLRSETRNFVGGKRFSSDSKNFFFTGIIILTCTVAPL